MATITNSNLYPPIVDTYMPAFLVDGDNELKKICRVYFSISSFNSISEIKNAQVTLANQNTNISVLNTKKYPCGIKITPIYEDITKTSEDRYYIELEPSDLEPEYGYDEDTDKYTISKFNINEYYKVQIRFTSVTASDIDIGIPPSNWSEKDQKYTDAQAIDSWLVQNLDKFSEWSTVCLIRGISSPILSVKGLDPAAETTIWTTSKVDLIATLSFLDPLETETLKSYRIKLFDKKEKLLTDSGDLYSNNYANINEINYTFKYAFQDGETYSIQLMYTTKSLYTAKTTFKFSVIEETTDALQATISAVKDIDNGRIGIKIKGLTEDIFNGNIVIRRTSSESNFTLWEDMTTITIENTSLFLTWYDYTVVSGVWYKYCAQKKNVFGNRGIALFLDTPQMLLFEDIFLNADNTQLSIKFNPQISSFKRTVSESKIDTIGSKYPFIKRNGYMEYREFPISGLITCFMDNEEIFISKNNLYGEEIALLYDNYNKKENITNFNDFTYERDFREKVLDFLYKNNVKLFRSPSEGNILVKLMDINLTPEIVLGRRIYTFSCMAYEIADFTLNNCRLYNIASLDESKKVSLEFETANLGQLNQTFPAYMDIFTILNEKYSGYAQEGYEIKLKYIDYLRIEINSDPSFIQETESGPIIISDPMAADYIGYLFYINDNPIILESKNGNVYELKNGNIEITSIVFPVETDALIDYNIIMNQIQKTEDGIATTSYYKKVGQLQDVFQVNESIYQKIWNKYYEETPTYIQKLVALNSVKIETDPGAIVCVQEFEEEKFNRHIVGETCLLEIVNSDSTIIDIYFAGVYFELASEMDLERIELFDNKYAEDKEIYLNLESILPKTNYVYTLENGEKYIWYKEKWWSFSSETQTIECSIEAVIDYYCEVTKGVYI